MAMTSPSCFLNFRFLEVVIFLNEHRRGDYFISFIEESVAG